MQFGRPELRLLFHRLTQIRCAQAAKGECRSVDWSSDARWIQVYSTACSSVFPFGTLSPPTMFYHPSLSLSRSLSLSLSRDGGALETSVFAKVNPQRNVSTPDEDLYCDDNPMFCTSQLPYNRVGFRKICAL